MADYIHLNPVRSGWVGGASGTPLRDWHWSSFPIDASRRTVKWLETDRVLRAFELAENRRGRAAYAAYLEERAKDREGSLSDESLRALRRGWYLGDESFRDRLGNGLAEGLRPMRRSSPASAWFIRRSRRGVMAPAHRRWDSGGPR